MGNYYVSSLSGDNSNDGLGWATSKSTLSGALTSAGPGDTIFVSHQHQEITANKTLFIIGSGAAGRPLKVLCVNDDSEPPTGLATSAIIATSGSPSDIRFEGFNYFYGINFITSTGATFGGVVTSVSTSPHWIKLDSCSVAPSDLFYVGTSSNHKAGLLELENTSIYFKSSVHSIFNRGPMVWKNTPTGTFGSSPTYLFITQINNQAYPVTVEGVGFSNFDGSLVDFGENMYCKYVFKNCNFSPSTKVKNPSDSNSNGPGGIEVIINNCDSNDTNYRYEKHSWHGSIYNETGVTRTNGASNGTTDISYKMISSTGVSFVCPLYTEPVMVWNEQTGVSLTATIEFINDGVTLKDDEVWVEIEYLGTQGAPLSLISSDKKSSILSTGVNQTTSSVDWSTNGLSSPVKQKLETIFSPLEKGLIKARVYLARPSTTGYFCPKIDIN